MSSQLTPFQFEKFKQVGYLLKRNKDIHITSLFWLSIQNLMLNTLRNCSKIYGQVLRMTQRYSYHCPDSLRDGVQILEADYNLTTVEEKRDVANLRNP